MVVPKRLLRWLAPFVVLMSLALVAAGCGGDDDAKVKEVVKFHDGQWGTLWLHNAIAMYVTEKGYGYPVEEIQGTTGTMKAALPVGELHVNMEMWRFNQPAWYREFVEQKGDVVDLTGSGKTAPLGAKGKVLAFAGQGFYVPTYIIEANPGLKSVSDLPNYKEVFKDPEDPSKGVMVNCIIGWQCQKINRAKWVAYGLDADYNVMEPGSGAALDAAITGPYKNQEPVLSYYWEPTSLISTLDMTRLEEPDWTQDCQDALEAAIASEPYESAVGCAYPGDDVHIGVHSGLVDRAPEVTEFLANLFVGAKGLAELEAWKNDNDKEWRDAAVKYLKENESTWKSWITSDAAKKVNKALDEESA